MLKEAFTKAKDLHILRQDVTGVAISKKITNGKETDEDCITIYVPVKKPISDIPKGEQIEKEILGVKTDVIEARFKANAVYTERVDPLRPGASISPESGSVGAGTIGAIVYSVDDGTVYALTNYHVVYGVNKYEYMIQPGRSDNGMVYYDRFGQTINYFFDSTGDAAIIEIDETLGRDSSELVYASNQRLLSIGEPSIGDLVEKVGRTTGITYGKVSSFGTFSVDYSAEGLGTINLDGHSIVARDDAEEGYVLSLGGDSGSSWYNADNEQITGLHVAGTDAGDVSIACSIETVFNTLNISLSKKSAKLGTGQNMISLPWFSAAGTLTTSVDIIPQGDFMNAYAFTLPEFYGSVFARLPGETIWKEVGGQTITPSCLLGNFENSKRKTVEFRFVPGVNLVSGEANIEIYFSHGEEVRSA